MRLVLLSYGYHNNGVANFIQPTSLLLWVADGGAK